MNIMLDLETLDTAHTACIVQIGAVVFTTSKEIEQNIANHPKKKFYVDIGITDQVKLGRTICTETLSWWMDGDTMSDARKMVFERKSVVPFKDAMDELNSFIKDAKKASEGKFCIWGNSPSFDMCIIKDAMGMIGIKPAWKYGEEMDVRTLKRIDKLNGMNVFQTLKENPTKHDALEDAMAQADFVTRFHNLIRDNKYHV